MKSVDKNEARPRKLRQHIASLSVTLGAFATGLAYVWTSPAGENGANLHYRFEINPDEFSWVGSIFNIGAAVISVPIGILTNLIGRRRAMLALTAPFTISWACVIWPNSINTLMIGRFILGASGGAFFVTIPMYTAEIADKEERGKLGSYFAILLCLGNLVAYTLDLLHNMFLLSLISAAAPLVFFAIFFFMPESPTYYLMRGNEEAARKTLIWLRGTQYDVESELEEKRNALAEAKISGASFFVAIKSRAARRGLVIGYGLMLFQSFCGVDVILFYANDIFTRASGSDEAFSTIVVAALQVVAVFSFTFVIEKLGRRVLLLISGPAMFLSTLALGVYFYFQANDAAMNDFKWVPLVSISCFLVCFSLGYGEIPWIMMDELFSPEIKALAISTAYVAAWMMSFVATKFYNVGIDNIGLHGVFWIYSVVIALSIVFVYFVVPETKGKSLEELQLELSG